MERRTSREKLVRILTVRRKQMEYVLRASTSRRSSGHIKGEKGDVGSSTGSSSTCSSSKSSVSQIFSSSAEFLPSCCSTRAVEVKDSFAEEDQRRRWLHRRWKKLNRKLEPSPSA